MKYLSYGLLQKLANRFAYRSVTKNMKPDRSKEGYELPASQKEDDCFSRWRVASEIWEIIRRAPSDWSVRIGIYGRWGEGKTSVLNFIHELAEKENNIVVWFNPWSIRDRDELWASFLASVLAKLESENISIKGGAVLKAKLLGRNSLNPIKNAAEINKYSKAVVGGSLSLIKGFLEVDGESFKSISEGLEGRKLVIIIDDLDRTNPEILPELLLSLREVLDLPSISFVLAFDVDIVANAVAGEFSAWGRGEEFLEKIIDFPFSLPTPTEEQVEKFVEKEISSGMGFINRDALEGLYDVLPKNPRKLKLLFRYFWILKWQIERHKETELDWVTITTWQLIRIESAHTARILAENIGLIDDLVNWHFFKSDTEDEYSKVQREALDVVLGVLETTNINSDDIRHERILQLVTRLAENNSASTAENMLYQINLLDKPHAVTWKEFDELFSGWVENNSTKYICSWLLKQSNKVSATLEEVAKEVFGTLVSYWSKRLDDAASAQSMDEYLPIMDMVARSREMMAMLVADGLPCVGVSFFRTPENFEKVLGVIQQWIHFSENEKDEEARVAEEKMLIIFVEHLSSDSVTLLTIIKPWDEGFHAFKGSGGLIDKLNLKLTKIIEPKVADTLIELLESKGGIALLWGRDAHTAEKYVLFSHEGSLWEGPRKAKVLEILERANLDEEIHQNAYEILRMLAYGAKEGLGFPYSPDHLKNLIKDQEISGPIWKAAVSRRIQYRAHSELLKIREQFSELSGSKEHLPLPDWIVRAK